MPGFSFLSHPLPDGVLAAQVETTDGVTQILSDTAPFVHAASGMSNLLRRWSVDVPAPRSTLEPTEVLALYGVEGALAWWTDGDLLRLAASCGAGKQVAHLHATIPTCYPFPVVDALASEVALFFDTADDMCEEYPAVKAAMGAIGESAWAFVPWAAGGCRGVTSMWWQPARRFTDAEKDELVGAVQRVAETAVVASVATG